MSSLRSSRLDFPSMVSVIGSNWYVMVIPRLEAEEDSVKKQEEWMAI